MRKKHGAKKSVEKFQEPSELINNIDFDVLQGAEFKDGGEVGNKQTYAKWKGLVNMSKSELKEFYDSKEGKEAGLKAYEAKAQGIDSGRESARWIYKMKSTPVAEWTPAMWKWANKQISFISRMKGVKGDLYDSKGNKTRKHTALLIWGHNPEKYNEGGMTDFKFKNKNNVLKNNTPTKTQNNTIMEDLKFNELPHIDTVSNGDAVLIREEVFGGDMEKPKHIGTRYITCQVMGKGGIAGTLNLKVKKSVGANAYKMNEMIERPLRDVIETGKKLIVEPISDTASKLGMDDLFQGDLVGYKGGNYEVGGVTACGKFVKCKNDKGLDSEIELEEFMDNSTLIKRKK
jgi:hypothetical protein